MTPQGSFLRPRSQGPNDCWKRSGYSTIDHRHKRHFWNKARLFLSTIKPGQNLTAHDTYLHKVPLAANNEPSHGRGSRKRRHQRADWIATVNEINRVERLTFPLRLRFDRRIKVWKKWLCTMWKVTRCNWNFLSDCFFALMRGRLVLSPFAPFFFFSSFFCPCPEKFSIKTKFQKRRFLFIENQMRVTWGNNSSVQLWCEILYNTAANEKRPPNLQLHLMFSGEPYIERRTVCDQLKS